MTSQSSLDITLLGREYRVACEPGERDSLLAAVAYVDAKMAEIATRTKSTGERLAVMTALNLAHELLASGASGGACAPAAEVFDRGELTRRIGAIEARLDEAMAEQNKLF